MVCSFSGVFLYQNGEGTSYHWTSEQSASNDFFVTLRYEGDGSGFDGGYIEGGVLDFASIRCSKRAELLQQGGCLDADACNFDSSVSVDDGSCEYSSCAGCTDSAANNFDPNVWIDNASCTYSTVNVTFQVDMSRIQKVMSSEECT